MHWGIISLGILGQMPVMPDKEILFADATFNPYAF
jgi:hypothetical protein